MLEIGLVISAGIQIEAYLILRILYVEWRPWKKEHDSQSPVS
jgi:hypothetical protein